MLLFSYFFLKAPQWRESYPESKIFWFPHKNLENLIKRDHLTHPSLCRQHTSIVEFWILDISGVLKQLRSLSLFYVASSQIDSQPANLQFRRNLRAPNAGPTHEKCHRPTGISRIIQIPRMSVMEIHRKPRNNMLEMYSQSKIGPFCIFYQLSCWFIQTLLLEIVYFRPLAQRKLGFSMVKINTSIFIQPT